MAGIGFELKKIFKEESVTSLIGGIAYSSIVTVGPTIIVIMTIIALYFFLGLTSVSYAERELLSSTILYVFIFALLVTAPFNGVMSRYIADKIYDDQYEDILPSFYTGVFLNTLLGELLALPFVYRLIVVGGVAPIFAAVTYAFFMIMIIAFFSMIYLSATKDYKVIALFYGMGMAVTFVGAWIFFWLGEPVIHAILYGVTLGFFLIAFLEFSYMRKHFKQNSKKYFDCLRYFREQYQVLFTNFFYILGLYIHNFVFWGHPNHLVIAKSYYTMQSYDMATTLAMFSNISMIVIFTVLVETNFHDRYQKYMESIIGKTWQDIQKDKKAMFRLLIQQVSFLAIVQAIITTILFLIAMAVLPDFGFGGSVLRNYASLIGAYFAIFLMYCNIIFMFYFNDNKGAMMTAVIFCISVLVGSYWARENLSRLYGLGAFAGAMVGWSFSFYRLRYMEKHFDAHIFCNTTIIERIIGKVPKSIIYKKEQGNEG